MPYEKLYCQSKINNQYIYLQNNAAQLYFKGNFPVHKGWLWYSKLFQPAGVYDALDLTV